MRKVVKVLALAMATFVVIAFVALSTQTGQSGLLRIAEKLARSPDQTIGIGALEGSLFGDGAIADVSVSDARGPWLKIHNISFSWRPSRLLMGRFDAAFLRAEAVTVLRRPEAAAEAGADVGNESSGAGLPVRITVGDFDVKRVDIGSAVLGEAVRLRVHGEVDVGARAGSNIAALQVQRTDKLRAGLNVKIAFRPERRLLDVAIEGHENAGGIVSKLLGLGHRPELGLNISGRGGLDAWKADLTASASGKPFIAGVVRFDRADGGRHRLSGNVAGFVAPFMPQTVAPLFTGKTDVAVSARLTGLGDGVLRTVEDAVLRVSGERLSVNASGGVDVADGYVYGRVDGAARRKDGEALEFGADGGAADVSLQSVVFEAMLPEGHGARTVSGQARVDGIRSDALKADALQISLGGAQPTPRGKGFDVFEGIRAAVSLSGADRDTPLGAAIGETGDVQFSGSYADEKLNIDALKVNAADARLQFAGAIDHGRLKGKGQIALKDFAHYSMLAGRALKGSAGFDADVEGMLEAGQFTALISGESNGIVAGIATVDGLLAGKTTYKARLDLADGGGFSVQDVVIENAAMTAVLSASGPVEPLAASGKVTFMSLAALDPSLAGKARIDVEVGGRGEKLSSKVQIVGEGVTINGKVVENPVIGFAGKGPLSGHAGKLTVTAVVGGEKLDGSTGLRISEDGSGAVEDLKFEVAGARARGGLSFGPKQTPLGGIKVDAQNLSRIGKAFGVALSGRFGADVSLSDADGRGAAKIAVLADRVVAGDFRVARAQANGQIADYLNAPVGKLVVQVAGIGQRAKAIGDVNLNVDFKGETATFASKGKLDGGVFDVSGDVRRVDGGQDVRLKAMSYAGRKDMPAVRVLSPSVVSVKGASVRFKALKIGVGDGSLQVDGLAGDKLDLAVGIRQVPAAIAAIAAPELGVIGRINGKVDIAGSPSDPRIDAKVTASGLSVAEMRSRQLPAADISAEMRATDTVAKVNVNAKARGGLDLALSGDVNLKGKGNLALKGGGTVPLVLANVFLAEGATRVAGDAQVAIDIAGTLAAPKVDGRVSVAGATLSDSSVGLDLSRIDADIGFTQAGADIRKLVAVSKKGGSISGAGGVRLGADGAAAVDASITLQAFKFGNQDPVAGDVDGAVKVSGPVDQLVARGDVFIRRMDVSVPNQMPQSVASLDIRHVNAPARFQDTSPSPKDDGVKAADPRIALHLDVHAAERIFVRGRGLDAQLGGDVKIRGSANAPVTDGQFSMTRGRLSILGRTLDFTRGNILFMGSVEPALDMEASADADGTTVIVTVTGAASKPVFKFSSSPELPEDEVVSLLLFNKKLAKLSPTQLVQLAGEVDKIGGLSSGPSTLDKMKSAVGIDVLDVQTDAQGNAQATAGSYLNEDTYVGVQQGLSLGKSRVIIDHNLTKNLKARGEVGSDGDSKLGVGVEWDY